MGSQLDLDLTPFEFGWLIGILEGEGTFQYNKSTQRVTVGMSDEDTMNKVTNLFERILGAELHIREQIGLRDNHALMYYVDISGNNARTMMRLVVRHMSQRRRQKIWQCLNKYKAPSPVKLDLVKLGLVKEAS